MATGAEYNWMVLWKSLNTEMPQNKEETPQKLGFEGFPFFLQKLRKRLKKTGF